LFEYFVSKYSLRVMCSGNAVNTPKNADFVHQAAENLAATPLLVNQARVPSKQAANQIQN
jgi:hypothetical protein